MGKDLLSRGFTENDVDENGKQRKGSFIRGFVKGWWVPILDADFNLLTLNDATTIEPQNANLNTAVLWHYSDFDDYSADFMDVGLEISPGDERTQIPHEIIFLMNATRVLGQMDKASMLGVWKAVSTVDIPKGGILFQKGAADDQLYVLTAGLMEVVIVEGTQRIRLKKIRPGNQIYSILSFIDVITGHGTPIKTIEVKALQDSRLVKVPVSSFRVYGQTVVEGSNNAIYNFI